MVICEKQGHDQEVGKGLELQPVCQPLCCLTQQVLEGFLEAEFEEVLESDIAKGDCCPLAEVMAFPRYSGSGTLGLGVSPCASILLASFQSAENPSPGPFP